MENLRLPNFFLLSEFLFFLAGGFPSTALPTHVSCTLLDILAPGAHSGCMAVEKLFLYRRKPAHSDIVVAQHLPQPAVLTFRLLCHDAR